jgi:alkanesulfonate monooxygenase SsuD/methylene tetrahydromethanopterin reductase-like flavin-dependent oxidoreductase (luciferase family)
MSTDLAVLTEATNVAAADSALRGELSVFLGTPAGNDPGQVYRDALDSIQVADALGYSYAWVAEAHFSSLIGVPAVLSLLAAATQVADRIRLGTAVVPLAFDNSLRLAETAALVNALSAQRLEFGVGKGNPRGFSTDAYNAFGLHEEDRNQLFARSLAELKEALRGTIHAGEKQVTLYPPAQDLLDRIWQATGDHATAAAAGAAGDGLLLFRTTPEGIAGDVQSRLIDSYLSSFDRAPGDPRIGVSRPRSIPGYAVARMARSWRLGRFRPHRGLIVRESRRAGSVIGHGGCSPPWGGCSPPLSRYLSSAPSSRSCWDH